MRRQMVDGTYRDLGPGSGEARGRRLIVKTTGPFQRSAGVRAPRVRDKAGLDRIERELR